jgi:hypothetical protein
MEIMNPFTTPAKSWLLNLDGCEWKPKPGICLICRFFQCLSTLPRSETTKYASDHPGTLTQVSMHTPPQTGVNHLQFGSFRSDQAP